MNVKCFYSFNRLYGFSYKILYILVHDLIFDFIIPLLHCTVNPLCLKFLLTVTFFTISLCSCLVPNSSYCTAGHPRRRYVFLNFLS